jgi:hypothetical protein
LQPTTSGGVSSLPESAHRTTSNQEDANDIAPLDRHYVVCKRFTPLNRFHLVTRQGSKDWFAEEAKQKTLVKYEYDCLDTGNRFPHMDHYFNTNEDFSGGKGLIYLDRHDVSCADYKGLLTSFRLVNFEGMVHYEYNCLKYDQHELSCRNQETSPQTFEDKLQFLDRHDVNCDGMYDQSL